MCGIIGYIGDRDCVPILLDGLKKLEYRGYDSAGIAVMDGGTIAVRKKNGRLSELEKYVVQYPINGSAGIGHTRWATHGEPSDENAHPHTSMAGDIAVVHNGIIENHARLRAWLTAQGVAFTSQTDTEVLAHLIHHHYEGDLIKAVEKALTRVEGSYALAVMSAREPGEIIVARKDSPLVVGQGDGEQFIASDIPALLAHTRDVYFLNDRELARVTREGVEIYDEYGMTVARALFHVDWDMASAEKGGYAHFMLKEIHEEPTALRETLRPRIGANGRVDFTEIGLDDETLRNSGRIIIVACGTAYHAGLAAKYAFERTLGIPVEADIASEFRYRDPIVNPGDLIILISQSGETADTLAALRLGRSKGARILAITNVVGSTISREADAVFYTWAGPEIAVASTKAYTTQLMALSLLLIAIGRARGTLSDDRCDALLGELGQMESLAEQVLKSEPKLAHFAHLHSSIEHAYYLGRNLDYAVALEGSLKLKEISYIHSEAFPAGELKHGPIALIERGTLVVALCTQPALYEKIASNIREVRARGARVLIIARADARELIELSDEWVELPEADPLLMPMLSVIPAQLLAYYCSVERGIDVDKPRNLAKSVTVE
ncbi:MAG: glutamine--fructose-6-phosphate transaminase (isomerizing) [Clostridiales bacterium]|nr:glutamine--fructose-6-phosphate transaminase (isomerizing) [Clostridiales bacterium]